MNSAALSPLKKHHYTPHLLHHVTRDTCEKWTTASLHIYQLQLPHAHQTLSGQHRDETVLTFLVGASSVTNAQINQRRPNENVKRVGRE
jgi:hypothetical protein